MIPSPLLRRAVVAALAALAITWPGLVSARAQTQPRDGFSRTSPSGSYLAARHAGGQRDVAAAASYYRAALRADPGNNELLGRTFVAVLANGEVDEAAKLAERVLQVDKHDRIARLVLGVRAVKQKQYPVARRELAQSISGPITDLAATLLSAWTMASPSEAKNSSFSASVSCTNSASMAAEIITERAPRAAAYSATRRLSELPEAAFPSSTLAM